MANVFHKLKGFFGFNEEEEFEDTNYEDEGDESTPVSVVTPRRPRKNAASQSGNIVSIHGNNITSKLIVYRPVSYDDTQNIIDSLKNRRPIIVNMEGIERETAQRILDFMFGACYAVDGRLYKVNGRIFVVAPANCDVVGNSDY